MLSDCLFRRILGERFDRLPMAMRQFHDMDGGGKARGTCRVTRGRGSLSNLVAFLAGMPPAGTNVPLRLQITVDGDRERWVRCFGAHRMKSVCRARNGQLLERCGPFSFAFELNADENALRFHLKQTWFCLFRVPHALAPRIEVVAVARDSGWTIDAQAAAPIVGRLIHYEGFVEPQQ